MHAVSGYHSPGRQAATQCARGLRFRHARRGGRDLPPLLLLLRLPALIMFLMRVPRITLQLSREPAGVFIAEQLALRRMGVPRFRLAQGVLHIPHDFSAYMRGRRRQALRTNIRRAQDRGFTCTCTAVTEWTPPDRASRASTHAERWDAHDPTGEPVATAWLIVDADCALLYILTSTRPYARWLLHAAMVERLAEARCSLLITNSFDVPLMDPGDQYFQGLLGYTIARLRLRPAFRGAIHRPGLVPALLGSAALSGLAAGALVLAGAP